jgi:hypothetical protein
MDRWWVFGKVWPDQLSLHSSKGTEEERNETKREGRVGKRVDSIDKGKQNEIGVLAKKKHDRSLSRKKFFL